MLGARGLSTVVPAGLGEKVTFRYRTQKHVITNSILVQVPGTQQPSFPVLLEPPGWLHRVTPSHPSPTRLLSRSPREQWDLQGPQESLGVALVTEGLL